jgi:fructosamine-3-kinase
VGGGDINHAARLETADTRYFVKWHERPPGRFFECEALGLDLLREANAVRVPDVIGYGSVEESNTAFLILEWIEPGAAKGALSAERLGFTLAMQHQTRREFYGLDYDNYIGKLAQPNKRRDSWIAFYRDKRLGAQRKLAKRNGRLPAQRERLLEHLMDSLDQWINEDDCQPSLLHGDLWAGNWMVAEDGQPVILDPAVSYGDREADLAMTALFGGFPPAFYDAYHEILPRRPGHEQRQSLYQLYYLLCHLNLFGEGYGGSVDAILKQYR